MIIAFDRKRSDEDDKIKLNDIRNMKTGDLNQDIMK